MIDPVIEKMARAMCAANCPDVDVDERVALLDSSEFWQSFGPRWHDFIVEATIIKAGFDVLIKERGE